MDWKELQKRLEIYNNSPISRNTKQVMNSRTSLRPEDMQKVFELCKDGLMPPTQAYYQVTGKKGVGGDVLKRWFVNRGYPEFRVYGKRNQKWYDELQKHADKGLTSREIAEIYGMETDTVDAYFLRGKLKRKKKVSWVDRLTPFVEQGLTNQEIYQMFPDVKKSSIASYLSKTRRIIKKSLAESK